MIGIRQEITEFTYSNIVSTVPEWSPTTNYLLGDMVRIGSWHYKSLLGTATLPNVGKDPLTNLNTAWFQFEPSNQYACLDPLEETRTTWEGDGIVEFTRGQKNVIGFGAFNATSITLEYLDTLDNVLDTEVYTFSTNEYVTDEWEYGYADFYAIDDLIIYKPLKLVGAKIRITLSNGGSSVNCGLIYAGRSLYFGNTLNEVSFPDKRIGTRTVGVANFSTLVDDTQLTIKVREAKKLVNEIVLFVVDELPESRHGNMIFLGKINKVDGTAEKGAKNVISWEIEQNILT